jgi:oligopeptide transport system permease protein
MIPTVTNAGPLFAFLLTGSFIIEQIMIVPGIASEFVDAFRQPLDTRMILATTVLLATLIIVINLAVDVIVAWLDPRISHD